MTCTNASLTPVKTVDTNFAWSLAKYVFLHENSEQETKIQMLSNVSITFDWERLRKRRLTTELNKLLIILLINIRSVKVHKKEKEKKIKCSK